MSEQVLNGFSSIQFLETTCARRVGLLRSGFCAFDVINVAALSAQFVGRSTPAIYSSIFSAPSCRRASTDLHQAVHSDTACEAIACTPIVLIRPIVLALGAIGLPKYFGGVSANVEAARVFKYKSVIYRPIRIKF